MTWPTVSVLKKYSKIHFNPRLRKKLKAFNQTLQVTCDNNYLYSVNIVKYTENKLYWKWGNLCGDQWNIHDFLWYFGTKIMNFLFWLKNNADDLHIKINLCWSYIFLKEYIQFKNKIKILSQTHFMWLYKSEPNYVVNLNILQPIKITF